MRRWRRPGWFVLLLSCALIYSVAVASLYSIGDGNPSPNNAVSFAVNAPSNETLFGTHFPELEADLDDAGYRDVMGIRSMLVALGNYPGHAGSDDDAAAAVGGSDLLYYADLSDLSSRVFPLAEGTFRITQEFGCVPKNDGYPTVDWCPPERPSFHNGIDLGAKEGTIIYAAATGTVTFSDIDPDSASGNSVIRIVHEGRNANYATDYLHWRRTYVEHGEYVIAGQPIGEIGSIGYSTGPHLHFTVWDLAAGTAIDPMEWLKSSDPAVAAAVQIGSSSVQNVLYWLPQIEAAAARHRVPTSLVAAIITVESSGDPRAISPAGARGLMQVMPKHFQRYGISEDLWLDPDTNIDTGSRFLSELIAVNGTLSRAVAGYFGEGCDVLGTCTGDYVTTVFAWYAYYVDLFAEGPIDPDMIAAPPLPAGGNNPEPNGEPADQTPEPEATPSETPTEEMDPTPTAEATPAPAPSPTSEPDESPTPTPGQDESDDAGEGDEAEGPDHGPPGEIPEYVLYADLVEGFGSQWKISEDRSSLLRVDTESGDERVVLEGRDNLFAAIVHEDAVWVSETGAHQLLRIDPDSNEISHEIEVGDAPRGLMGSKGLIWVANSSQNLVVTVGTESNEVLNQIDVLEKPCYIWFERDALWVASCEEDGYFRIELLLDLKPEEGSLLPVLSGRLFAS